MEHHMFEHTTSITFYLTYAALMIGLMVCSVLSPIRTVTVDGRRLTVFGVAVSFEVPPAEWNMEWPDSDGSSNASGGVVDGGLLDKNPDVIFSSASLTVSSKNSHEVGNGATLSALKSPLPTSPLKNYSIRLTDASSALPRDDVDIDTVGDDSAFSSPLSPRPFSHVDSPRVEQGNNSIPRGNQTQWIYLNKIPSSDLTRCMTAYLAFASLCLFFSLLLIITMILLLLPTESGVPLRIVVRVVTVAGPLSAVLCFAMAAALGLQGKLVRHIADGYYMNSIHRATVSSLHSGFSTTVAAAFIALVMVLLSPVLWKQ